MTCGRSACVQARERDLNARNHRERYAALVAAGFCPKCGIRRPEKFRLCVICRSADRARYAEQQAKKMAEQDETQRLLALAARKARSAENAAARRAAGLPIAIGAPQVRHYPAEEA